jgi:hypothetical protein
MNRRAAPNGKAHRTTDTRAAKAVKARRCNQRRVPGPDESAPEPKVAGNPPDPAR